MRRFQQNRAVGGSADSLLEEPRRRQSVRAPGLPKVSFPCFPDQSLRNAWTAGSRGRLPCGPLGRSVWLWLPLCHLSVFFIFLLFRTLWLLRPPRNDSRGWWHRLLPTHFLTLPPATPARRSANTHPGPQGPRRRCCPAGPGGASPTRRGPRAPTLLRTVLCSGFPPLLSRKALRSRTRPVSAEGRRGLRRARGGTPRRPPSATSGKAPPPASPGPGVWPGTPPSQCPWHPSVVTHRPRPERLREPGVGSARGGKVTGRVTCGVASGRVLFVSIYLSFWLRGAEPRVGSGAQCGSATLLRCGRTGHS